MLRAEKCRSPLAWLKVPASRGEFLQASGGRASTRWVGDERELATHAYSGSLGMARPQREQSDGRRRDLRDCPKRHGLRPRGRQPGPATSPTAAQRASVAEGHAGQRQRNHAPRACPPCRSLPRRSAKTIRSWHCRWAGGHRCPEPDPLAPDDLGEMAVRSAPAWLVSLVFHTC